MRNHLPCISVSSVARWQGLVGLLFAHAAFASGDVRIVYAFGAGIAIQVGALIWLLMARPQHWLLTAIGYVALAYAVWAFVWNDNRLTLLAVTTVLAAPALIPILVILRRGRA